MIVTDRFVFLHLHKSGGTFARELILRFVPGAHEIGYHLPRSMIPAEHRAKPALGLVRNPWSYYVSWYSFQAEKKEPNALFRTVSENRSLDFAGTIHNMLELDRNRELLRLAVSALPASYGGRGLNLPGPALAEMKNSGRGFFSFLYHYMFDGEGDAPRICKMETLREDLPVLLEGAGQVISPAMRAFCVSEPPRNVSKHRPYREFYSPALRDLVEERDQDVIARHNYRF